MKPETFSFICACGKREYGITNRTAAEVAADRHEAQYIGRRAYAHDTTVLTEAN